LGDTLLLTAWPPPQLEIELKYLLDPEGYRKLLEILAKQTVGKELFTTYYLDTKKGHLKTSGFNVRIRVGEESAKMTLKFATVLSWDGESTPKMRWELEDDIDSKLARDVVEGREPITVLKNRGTQVLSANISGSKLEALKTMGQLDITRTKIDWKKGVCLEVDRFQIGGETIHEIEIEVRDQDPDVLHRDITSKLDEWKIFWEATDTSKRSRLFASIGKKKKS
jgi:uncharacterized protein YjbK